MIAAFVVDPLLISSLLWRTKLPWIAVNDWSSPDVCKMYALILVARRLEVYERLIEEWNKRVDENFNNLVKREMYDRVDVIDVA